MARLVVAVLAAPLLCGGIAVAESAPSARPPATSPQQPAAPGEAPSASPAGQPIDPAVRRLIDQEIDKVRQELRDEVRAEVQGAQSAAEFLGGGVEERPKLEFLKLNGYYRFRGDLFDKFDLGRDPDPSGYTLFPKPIVAPGEHSTFTTGNMRFRLDPTLNISEQVRIRSTIDMLDNIVLGQTPERSQYVVSTILNRNQVPPEAGFNSDRPSIEVKRVWGEVQTPLGLLSFGRMPDAWGLGILANPGNGLDDDFGDTIDRLQFAIPLGSTPLGPLTLTPMVDWISSGVISQDLRVTNGGRGIGQPFDLTQFDTARALSVKVGRIDTDEEMRRKFEKDMASVSYGAYYSYRSQSYEFPSYTTLTPPSGTTWSTTPPSEGQPNPAANDPLGPVVHTDAYAHVLDLWTRYRTKRFRLEGELAAIYGQVALASSSVGPIGPVLLRQFGGAVQSEWKFADGRLSLGGEAGFASGDNDPGFGNKPGRNPNPLPGDIEGAQYRPGDPILDIRNFRFNRAYRIDLILWREILVNVTDAWYLRPSIKYEPFEGLAATLALIYSQAWYASSTPSTIYKPLGLEADLGVSYTSDDGFVAFLDFGLLQPFDGLAYAVYGGRGSLSRASALRAGFAIKF